MTNDFRPYSNQSNTTIIRTLGQEVILEVAPEEELSAVRLTDQILEDYEKGELLTADASLNDAGSFGSVDLVTLIVIPLLVMTLGELCKQLAIWSIEELKKEVDTKKIARQKFSQMIDVIVNEKYEEIDKKVKSKKSKAKGRQIRKAVKIRVKNYLDVD